MSDEDDDPGEEVIPERRPVRIEEYEDAAGLPHQPRGVERTPELPPRPFLYTLDQIASLLSIEMVHLRNNYIHFDGLSVGARRPDFLLARNIAPIGKPTDWRVAEQDFARWLKRKGWRLHPRGWVT